jgi:hypothetical protein
VHPLSSAPTPTPLQHTTHATTYKQSGLHSPVQGSNAIDLDGAHKHVGEAIVAALGELHPRLDRVDGERDRLADLRTDSMVECEMLRSVHGAVVRTYYKALVNVQGGWSDSSQLHTHTCTACLFSSSLRLVWPMHCDHKHTCTACFYSSSLRLVWPMHCDHKHTCTACFYSSSLQRLYPLHCDSRAWPHASSTRVRAHPHTPTLVHSCTHSRTWNAGNHVTVKW